MYCSNMRPSFPCRLALPPIPQADASCVTPEAVSTAEAGSEEGAQVVAPLEATLVAVQADVSEGAEDIAATGSGGAFPASVGDVVTNFVDGAVDVGTTEQEKTDGEEVDMAGEGPIVPTAAAVPDAVPDVVDTATECAAIGAPMSAMGCEDSPPSVSVGVAAAGDEVSATLKNVQAEVEPVASAEEPETARSVSISDGLVEEDGAAVLAAATDGETGAGEALPVSTKLAVVDVERATDGLVGGDVTTPAGDDTAGSVEGAGSAEAVATALSSLVVEEVPEVEAAASLMENESADVVVSVVRPRDDNTMRKDSKRSGPLSSRSLGCLTETFLFFYFFCSHYCFCRLPHRPTSSTTTS